MKTTTPTFILALLLAGCTFGTPIESTTIPTTSSSQSLSLRSESSSSSTVTELRGMIEPVGITVYQQGTHKITLENGRIVLLESSTVDLNGYVGTKAKLTGVIRATVEADGQIMNVQTIALDDESTSSSTESSESTTSSSSSDASVSSSKDISSTSSQTTTMSSISSVSSTMSVDNSQSSVTSNVNDARVQTMLKANLASSNWTQEYCSKQTKYCVKVHKNWWYTGFGANGTASMRVDIGPDEIETVGDGVIVVTVEKGTPSNNPVGYNAIKQFDGEYVRISGPAALQAAIDYMATTIRKTE